MTFKIPLRSVYFLAYRMALSSNGLSYSYDRPSPTYERITPFSASGPFSSLTENLTCPLGESSLQVSKTLPLQPLSPDSPQIVNPSSLLGVKTLSCPTLSSSKQYLGQNSSSGTQRCTKCWIQRKKVYLLKQKQAKIC